MTVKLLDEPKLGRPSSYTEPVATEICSRISAGESLRAVCRDPEMPSIPTVRRWLRNNEGGDDEIGSFRTRYARAREDLYEHWAEEIMEIGDDGTGDEWTDEGGKVHKNKDVTQRSRLRVDTRKWLLSKLVPDKYGDKLQHEHTGSVEVTSKVSLRGRSKD